MTLIISPHLAQFSRLPTVVPSYFTQGTHTIFVVLFVFTNQSHPFSCYIQPRKTVQNAPLGQVSSRWRTAGFNLAANMINDRLLIHSIVQLLVAHVLWPYLGNFDHARSHLGKEVFNPLLWVSIRKICTSTDSLFIFVSWWCLFRGVKVYEEM